MHFRSQYSRRSRRVNENGDENGSVVSSDSKMQILRISTGAFKNCELTVTIQSKTIIISFLVSGVDCAGLEPHAHNLQACLGGTRPGVRYREWSI